MPVITFLKCSYFRTILHQRPTIMKLSCAVFVICIGLILAGGIHNDGQPGCKTEIEMQVVDYRNTWDPTRYWKCEVSTQPATAWKCPISTGWLDSQKKCVDWDDWIWEVPSPPPSSP